VLSGIQSYDVLSFWTYTVIMVPVHQMLSFLSAKLMTYIYLNTLTYSRLLMSNSTLCNDLVKATAVFGYAFPQCWVCVLEAYSHPHATPLCRISNAVLTVNEELRPISHTFDASYELACLVMSQVNFTEATWFKLAFACLVMSQLNFTVALIPDGHRNNSHVACFLLWRMWLCNILEWNSTKCNIILISLVTSFLTHCSVPACESC
jgi:hypothetical protein